MMLKLISNSDRRVVSTQGVDVDKIYIFLAHINSEYNPPLDTKVELHQYAEKILNNAVLFVEMVGDDIVGMVVLYCNDDNTKKAYIPLVGVLPTYQHRGIA